MNATDTIRIKEFRPHTEAAVLGPMRHGFLVQYDGRTVGDFLGDVLLFEHINPRVAGDGEYETDGWAGSHLYWCVKNGHVELEEAS